MFAKKISIALLGLVALPSIAAARPHARPDDSRAVASDRASARTDKPRERSTHAKGGRIDGLCARLACTPDQLAAIRSITHATRERLEAERKDDRELFARVKQMRKNGMSDDELMSVKAAIAAEHREYERLFHQAILGIAEVLDAEQRALFMRWIDKVGEKAVLGMSGRKPGLAESKNERAEGKRAASKRKRAAPERKPAAPERKLARHSAKA